MSTLFVIKNHIYLRYYDSTKGRGREIGTGETADRLGWIEARKFKKRFDADLETGLLRSRFRKVNDVLYLSEALDEFMQDKTTGPDKISPKTQMTYKRIVKYLMDACTDKPIRDYTYKDYKKLHTYLETKGKDNPYPEKPRVDKDGNPVKPKEKKKLSHNTIAGYYRYLHHFFNYFSKQINENPITLIGPQDKLPEAIPEDDLQLIMDKLMPDRNKYDIIYFLLWSGFRSNEACQLDWSQVNMDTGIIILENFKAKIKYDYYPIHEELYKHLTAMGPKKKGKLFPYSGPDELDFFARAQTGLDIRKHYTVHQLRKTFASRCINSGVDPYDLQKLMRHKSYSTTEKYYTEADLKRIGRVVDDKVKFKPVMKPKNEKADQ